MTLNNDLTLLVAQCLQMPSSPRVGLDDEIRAEGQPMGRFTSNGEDWLPDPNGTHDGFIWRLGFYTLLHQEQAS